MTIELIEPVQQAQAGAVVAQQQGAIQGAGDSGEYASGETAPSDEPGYAVDAAGTFGG